MPKPLTRRQLILMLIALLLMAGMAWLLRDFVRDIILQPLIGLGWVAWVGVLSLHQGLIWGVIVLVAMIVLLPAAFASPARRRGAAQAAGDEGPDEDEDPPLFAEPRGAPMGRYRSTSRFQYWKNGLDSLGRSPFARERVARDLQFLVTRILADQQRTSPEEIKARLAHGDLELEPAVAALFRVQRGFAEIDNRRWWQKLLGRRPALASADLDVEALVRWLEEQTGAGF
jgi:hypothetical protein